MKSTLSLLLAALLLPACGSDPAPSSTVDSGPGGSVDADLAEVEYQTWLRLLNQEVYREDDAFAAGGTGILYLFPKQPLPLDDRQSYMNSDNERCTSESFSNWPTSPAGGAEWPSQLLSAGDLTFEIEGGPNTIVFSDFEGGYIRDQPAAKVQGSFTHTSFFESSNLPAGANFTMSAAGNEIGSFSTTGSIPPDYTVSKPNIVAGGDTIDVGQPFTFQWSPALPGARMEVIMKVGAQFLRCNFADDGEAEVPATAMAALNGGPVAGQMTVQTIRQLGSKKVVNDSNGKGVEIDLLFEHVKIGKFDTEDSRE